jgi:hypothetical protein
MDLVGVGRWTRLSAQWLRACILSAANVHASGVPPTHVCPSRVSSPDMRSSTV